MSNRQLGLLKYISEAPRQTLGLEQLSHINQLTVGSFRRKSRGYIIETPDRHGVRLTWEGKQALKQFEHGNFLRSVSRMKFSGFLNLDVYDGSGKERPKKKRRPKAVIPIKRAAAAG